MSFVLPMLLHVVSNTHYRVKVNVKYRCVSDICTITTSICTTSCTVHKLANFTHHKRTHTHVHTNLNI